MKTAISNDDSGKEISSILRESDTKKREERLQQKFKDAKIELTENSGKLTHSDGSSVLIEFEKE